VTSSDVPPGVQIHLGDSRGRPTTATSPAEPAGFISRAWLGPPGSPYLAAVAADAQSIVGIIVDTPEEIAHIRAELRAGRIPPYVEPDPRQNVPVPL
jgi:hypothetical protein